MHLKGKYSWLKHLDFTLIDLLSLAGAFCLSYYLKFDDLVLNSEWKSILLILILIQLVINLLMNPYSGIFRRRFYDEIVRGVQMALYNLVITSLMIYAMKFGDRYSREAMFVTFLLYICISL